MEKTETITSAFTLHEIQNLLGSKSCLQIMTMLSDSVCLKHPQTKNPTYSVFALNLIL